MHNDRANNFKGAPVRCVLNVNDLINNIYINNLLLGIVTAKYILRMRAIDVLIQ